MHRFRKKSDAKRPSFQPVVSPEPVDHFEPYEAIPAPDSLPELPTSSDFRTSLILTDLSRRFTLLGATSTDAASVDALRSRLANQRARGAENQITEEEEEMIIETLGLRPKQSADEFSSSRSALSIGSTSSSKRYSNNLFGSGRFRDYSYVRSVQSKTSSIRTIDSSRTQTASHDSLGAHLDNNETSLSSTPDALTVRSAPLNPPAPYGGQPLSVAEYRLSKSLGSSGLRRASLALDEAIRSIEEEAEDEIVMPRSAPIARGSFDRQSPDSRDSDHTIEAGMAISSDKHISLEADSPRASPIPSRIMPGYIPGMPRPMTPRDTIDFDEQRSYSTTPRASSPSFPSVASPSPVLPSRRDSASASSRQSPRPKSPNVISPIFLQRSLNGRYTPEESPHGDSDIPTTSTWRRPTSPLSTASYQPLAVSVRPGTPSNVTWAPNGHNRDGSWASDFSEASPARSLRSPALPDSPLIGPAHTNMHSFSSTFSSASSFESRRPMSSISGVDIGSPVMGAHRPLRSPTPTQVGSRSPTSGSFSPTDTSPQNGSRRSSKQNTPSTPFTLGPFQPLFSPIANSSRSSLESAGSSYHSWDGDKKDRTVALFADVDVRRPMWHDLSSNGQHNSGSPNSYSDDGEAEDVILNYAGLKKLDFSCIHEKLVNAAIAKTAPAELQPHRSPSLRRRRPSTSQSNYSLNNGRIVSPSPTAAGPALEQYPTLMTGVVDSMLSPITPVDASGQAKTDSEAPSPARRARDLTHVLFGEDATQTLTVGVQPAHVPNSAPLEASFPHYEVPPSSASATWPYPISRNPSTPRLPQSPEEHAELTREVQRKTEAAMVMLQKQPSTSNLALPHKPSTTRKRINTIPLPSPALTGGQSKIGSRLKRLRGSLRAKTNIPTADDLTPFPMELRSPPAVQTAQYDPGKFRVAGGPIPASATTESEGFRVPVPSPPASAGPGLRGFMARFRGKQRASETAADLDFRRVRAQSPHLSPPSTDNFHTHTAPQSGWPSQQTPYVHSPSDSSPPDSAGFHMRASPSSASTPTQFDPSPMSRQNTAPLYSPRAHHSVPSIETTPADESQAIRQLFDAASNLGLDQGALNDLLARSGSTSSRSTDWTMLTRNNSKVAATPDLSRDRGGGDISRSASHKTHAAAPPPPAPPEVISQPDHLRRPKEGGSERSAVVRRTIIYASDTRASTIDHSSRRRRASAASVSSRSVHDRAPTPPPVKSTTGRRFSIDTPVPQLPGSMPLKPDRLLIPAGDKPSSNYDSLYDMYSEKPATSPAAERGVAVPETLPAVEVLELENGQTIWSIVNGLRDADEYADGFNRTSFGSDYSIRDAGNDGMQVFFREHGRKNSGSSFLQRKKTTATAKSRPETKVYYSSPAEIGRLIESVSAGTEAGSFNILANRPGHSASSSVSETDWTVEERIEHLLAGVRR
ncbi:hypothetical protein C8F01DRAFT_1131766 [Mycena amicta]|nr:hypothetical protein C8F01DRAFT_1131766 [Mycena amicta]